MKSLKEMVGVSIEDFDWETELEVLAKEREWDWFGDSDELINFIKKVENNKENNLKQELVNIIFDVCRKNKLCFDIRIEFGELLQSIIDNARGVN